MIGVVKRLKKIIKDVQECSVKLTSVIILPIMALMLGSRSNSALGKQV